MNISTMRLPDLPFRNTIPLTSNPLFFSPSPKPPFFSLLKPFSALRTTTPKTSSPPSQNPSNATNNPSNSAPWLKKWPSPRPLNQSNANPSKSKPTKHPESRNLGGDSPTRTTAIERIVLRLRNLGLGSDDEDEQEEVDGENGTMGVTGDERLGDLLRRDWVRPDTILAEDDRDETVLPWEREEVDVEEEGGRGARKRAVKAPTLAELTIEDEELRRLRRLGMTIRERVSVAKAGVTGAVLEKIHDQWRKSELVRLKFHESLARDMRTAHEIVEVGQFC